MPAKVTFERTSKGFMKPTETFFDQNDDDENCNEVDSDSSLTISKDNLP